MEGGKIGKLILALLFLAASTPAGATVVDDLILDLKYGQADVRAGAARALGEAGGAGAVDPLISALEDEASEVRCEAAAALGEVRDARAVGPSHRRPEGPSIRW